MLGFRTRIAVLIEACLTNPTYYIVISYLQPYFENKIFANGCFETGDVSVSVSLTALPHSIVLYEFEWQSAAIDTTG